jgi:hypothetical protein
MKESSEFAESIKSSESKRLLLQAR